MCDISVAGLYEVLKWGVFSLWPLGQTWPKEPSHVAHGAPQESKNLAAINTATLCPDEFLHLTPPAHCGTVLETGHALFAPRTGSHPAHPTWSQAKLLSPPTELGCPPPRVASWWAPHQPQVLDRNNHASQTRHCPSCPLGEMVEHDCFKSRVWHQILNCLCWWQQSTDWQNESRRAPGFILGLMLALRRCQQSAVCPHQLSSNWAEGCLIRIPTTILLASGQKNLSPEPAQHVCSTRQRQTSISRRTGPPHHDTHTQNM